MIPPTQSAPRDEPAHSEQRRQLLRSLGVLLGASALPASAVWGAASSKQRFLEAPVFDLLAAVADTLVPKTDTPGAIEAGIPELIDSLLRDWASPPTRTQLTSTLAGIDAAAVAADGRNFVRLDHAARHTLLQAHDVAALRPAPRNDRPMSVFEIIAGPPVTDPAYAQLKTLVVTLYYSSRIGLTQELTYSHTPGKWQPSLPVTPDTRPAGGGGPF